MTKLRDRFWIWGHPVGSHNEGCDCGIKGIHSRMTTAESAYYLGARNALMIDYNNKPEPPFDQEAMALDPLKETIWSIVGALSSEENIEHFGHLDEILRIAKLHPNTRGAIFDDFFFPKRTDLYTPEVLEKIRLRLHGAESGPLDMWVVLYEYQLERDDIQKHINEFDGVTFWTWWQDHLSDFDKNLEKVKSITKGKRLLLGCYMYDYGAQCQMSLENIEYQLNRYKKALINGDAEGVILLSNTIGDSGFPAVEFTRKWLNEHGDDEI